MVDDGEHEATVDLAFECLRVQENLRLLEEPPQFSLVVPFKWGRHVHVLAWKAVFQYRR